MVSREMLVLDLCHGMDDREIWWFLNKALGHDTCIETSDNSILPTHRLKGGCMRMGRALYV